MSASAEGKLLMETYFGKPEHVSEPGTSLSPTMHEVSADRGLVSPYQAILDSFGSMGRVKRVRQR